ncbi:hypothetical protein TTHERM_00471300 (macronuclear) [Tetrahymena thermophila SB210]|uniref:Uncharacterized protein n=1 Tax=Tetrahymena thermophila (strain SB210) TaxID=312017 RepID=I7LTJ3_TETTS|nr:hypothetical protein TTHERM_00471300 [Tetrahymena thermophila SB210]EAR85354.3 hypothetical protein TTHERM_00471300 [Tetrahymena thermophila SB210]|eukprot:XP_001033017.3 hypothetical protein TTHERM_00471300 [Tetrahymena thermophila SB210]
MYNSSFTQKSQVLGNSYQSNNPEVNEIIKRHEEIANSIKKMRSASQVPPSYANNYLYTPSGSISNIQDDQNEVETIITTTTMKITPQTSLTNSYAPQQYQRSNNFLNPNIQHSLQQPQQTSDLIDQLKRANQQILNISQDLRGYNDNLKKSQISIGGGLGSSQISYGNQSIIQPISRRNNFETFNNQVPSINNSQYLSAGNTYQNPRSASVYSSRNELPQTNSYNQSFYPTTRGVSQKRVTEITTTTYNNELPVHSHLLNSGIANSRANLASSQNPTPRGTSQSNIHSLNQIHDSDDENDYIKRIYVKGDGFEYEEIVDEENPQNNYKALRDQYHDEWQRLDYTPDFIIPFLKIQEQQKAAQNSMSQINASQISNVPLPAKYEFQPNCQSRYILDDSNFNKSHVDTTANISQSYIPTYKSYAPQNY